MNITPLGEQIIIRTLPPETIGSIIIPPSAKGITMQGAKGPEDAVHFTEAEVIAVGPGKQVKDQRLLDDLMTQLLAPTPAQFSLKPFTERYDNRNGRVPMFVKPGDRILYHPAVQKFDRDITELMRNGDVSNGSQYFIIREESVLAVIEP